MGTTYLFLQLLKLATSHFVHNLGLGSSLPRNNVYDQNLRGSWLGEHPKTSGPPTYYCNFNYVEGGNFKFGTQLGFGE